MTASPAQTPAGSAKEDDVPFFQRPEWNAPEPWRTDRWYLQTSYLTVHFHYDPDHQQAAMLDTSYYFKERWLDGQWFAGLALFTNSFGQFSQYAYGGLKWRPLEEHQPFYLKLSAGVVHGYSGEYQDKIPFNSSGFAPGIIPSAGYCWNRYCGEIVLLGFNALLFTVGVTIP
ncbi:MAG: sn-glycerol-3-phosphate transporter [Burkholderiales bacterium]